MDNRKLRSIGQALTLFGQFIWLFLAAVVLLACTGFCLWVTLTAY